MKYVRILAVLIAILLVMAYATRSRSNYAVEIVNQTGFVIDNASVRASTYNAVMGVIVNGGQKTYGQIRQDVPPSFQISWTDPQGRAHAVTVQNPTGSEDFEGVFRFTIARDENVVASVRRH